MPILTRAFKDGDIVTSGSTHISGAEAVGQLVKYRLRLFMGEYPFNINEGVDWMGKVLGKQDPYTRESEIKRVIAGTPGVIQLSSFYTNLDSVTRKYTVICGIITEYGSTTVEVSEP